MHIELTQVEPDTGQAIGKALVNISTSSFIEDKEDNTVSVYGSSDMFFYCRESLEEIYALLQKQSYKPFQISTL